VQNGDASTPVASRRSSGVLGGVESSRCFVFLEPCFGFFDLHAGDAVSAVSDVCVVCSVSITNVGNLLFMVEPCFCGPDSHAGVAVPEASDRGMVCIVSGKKDWKARAFCWH
jgi:hypothetical protein